MKLTRQIFIFLLLLSCQAGAQSLSEPPLSVSECTLLKDPVALRNCVLLFEAQRQLPAPDSPSTSQPVNPFSPPASSATERLQPDADAGGVFINQIQ